jgi:hypothetical protein
MPQTIRSNAVDTPFAGGENESAEGPKPQKVM